MGDRRGLTPEQWSEVRTAYESGEAVLAIAKRLGARRQTIMDRAKRELWTAQPTAHVSGPEVRKTAQRKVIDMVSRQAVDVAKSSGLTDEIGKSVAAELLATAEAGRLAAEYTIDILKRAKSGEIKPAAIHGVQTDVGVYKDAMAGYRTFVGTVRENAGIERGEASVGSDADADKSIVIVQRRLEPRKIDVDKDGRLITESA